MEWVYEKHSKDLECSPDTNNQSSKCSSLANLEERNFTMMTKDTVDCLGEDMMVSRPTPLVIEEGHVEDKSLVSAEINVVDEDSMQESCKEDVHQLLNNFSETPRPDDGGLGEATNLLFGVSADLLEKATDEESEEAKDKDKAIKMLREEVGISPYIYKKNMHILMHTGRVSLFLCILYRHMHMQPPIDFFLAFLGFQFLK